MHPGTAIGMNVFVNLQWRGSQQVSQTGFCNHLEVLHIAERQKVLLYVRKQNKSEDLPFESLHIADHTELSLQTECLKFGFKDSTEF